MYNIEEQGEIVEQADEEIARFIALRDLTSSVLALEVERERITQSIRTLARGYYIAPERTVIVVHPIDEEGQLTAERVGFRDWGETAGMLYHPAGRGGTQFSENIYEDSDHRETFGGSRIDYDVSTGKVWVYNADNSFRVLADESVIVYSSDVSWRD